MISDKRKKEGFFEKNKFLIASSLFSFSSFLDGFATRKGILEEKVQELNPLIQSSIENLGVEAGIFVPKIFFGAVVIYSCNFLRNRYLNNETRVDGKNLLYAGSFAYLSLAASIPIQEYLKNFF
jgi:hypothetical protein